VKGVIIWYVLNEAHKDSPPVSDMTRLVVASVLIALMASLLVTEFVLMRKHKK
jgi:hypothetical protein